jgi:hypothetical protein
MGSALVVAPEQYLALLQSNEEGSVGLPGDHR